MRKTATRVTQAAVIIFLGALLGFKLKWSSFSLFFLYLLGYDAAYYYNDLMDYKVDLKNKKGHPSKVLAFGYATKEDFITLLALSFAFPVILVLS